MIRRRDLFLAVTGASMAMAIGATSTPSPQAATKGDKRRAQYQANSAEVQTFYRVNGYPAKR